MNLIEMTEENIPKKIWERSLKINEDWTKGFVGKIEKPDAIFSRPVCKSNDILTFYLKIDSDCITKIKFWCENCDQFSFAMSDALCEIVLGQKTNDALSLNLETISNVLGVSQDEEGLNEHFLGAKRILETAIFKYNENGKIGNDAYILKNDNQKFDLDNYGKYK